MSEIVKELGQRLKPHELKERAKEVAVRQTRHWKDQIMESPLALGLLGGLLTAEVARWTRSRRRETMRQFDAGSELPEPGIGEKLGEVREKIEERAGEIKQKAVEVKDKAGDLARRAADRIPSAEDVKHAGERVKHAGERVGNYVAEEPLLGALAALATGAALGLLLPLTGGERRVLDPYRMRAGRKLDELKEGVKEKVEGLGERIRGDEKEPLFTEPKPTLQ